MAGRMHLPNIHTIPNFMFCHDVALTYIVVGEMLRDSDHKTLPYLAKCNLSESKTDFSM